MQALLCRLQALVGNLLATAIPRARIVPAVRGEDMSADAATVRSPSLSSSMKILLNTRLVALSK